MGESQTSEAQKSGAIRDLRISTRAFTLMFAVWMMFGVLGVAIKEELCLSALIMDSLVAILNGSNAYLRHDCGPHWRPKSVHRPTTFLSSFRGGCVRTHVQLLILRSSWVLQVTVYSRHLVELPGPTGTARFGARHFRRRQPGRIGHQVHRPRDYYRNRRPSVLRRNG